MSQRTAIFNSRRRTVERAQALVIEANEKLRLAVEAALPLHLLVTVKHSRGSFVGYIHRHDYQPGYVHVANKRTQLVSKRHWMDVSAVKL